MYQNAHTQSLILHIARAAPQSPLPPPPPRAPESRVVGVQEHTHGIRITMVQIDFRSGRAGFPTPHLARVSIDREHDACVAVEARPSAAGGRDLVGVHQGEVEQCARVRVVEIVVTVHVYVDPRVRLGDVGVHLGGNGLREIRHVRVCVVAEALPASHNITTWSISCWGTQRASE